VSTVYLRLTVTDMPTAWVGDAFGAAWARVTRTVWCRLPDAWFVGGVLTGHRRRQIADALCPAEDGDHLVVDWYEERLTAEQARTRPWRGDVAGVLVGTDLGLLHAAHLDTLSRGLR
jgi:hypothetical protein